jgi:hypothetical protein
MSEISSYVKLSPKETVLDNWEVVNDAGTPTIGEIVAAVVAGVVVYFAIKGLFFLVYEFKPIQDAFFRPAYEDMDREWAIRDRIRDLDYGSGAMYQAKEITRSPDDSSPSRDPNALTPEERALKKAELESQLTALENSRPWRGGLLRLIRMLVSLGVPLWLFGWPLISRPKVQGYIYLTNWRLLYFAYGQNRFRSLFDLQTVNLADVLGVHTFYSEGTFGKKRLRILIHTRFHDGLTIATGTAGTVLSRVPVLGPLIDRVLIRDTLGKDAFTLLPVLYSRIRVNAAAAATPGLSY